jgi:hypothetical protein
MIAIKGITPLIKDIGAVCAVVKKSPEIISLSPQVTRNNEAGVAHPAYEAGVAHPAYEADVAHPDWALGEPIRYDFTPPGFNSSTPNKINSLSPLSPRSSNSSARSTPDKISTLSPLSPRSLGSSTTSSARSTPERIVSNPASPVTFELAGVTSLASLSPIPSTPFTSSPLTTPNVLKTLTSPDKIMTSVLTTDGSVVNVDIMTKQPLYDVLSIKSAINVLVNPIGKNRNQLLSAKRDIYNVYSIASREEKLAMLKPYYQLQAKLQESDNKQLFRINGPSNPQQGANLDELSNGNDRMFLCNTIYERDDFELEDLSETQVTGDRQEWFTGYCDVCYRRIIKSCYAVRRPILFGGWLGCYCDWECVRNDYIEPNAVTNKLVDYFENQVKAIGILDREEALRDTSDDVVNDDDQPSKPRKPEDMLLPMYNR